LEILTTYFHFRTALATADDFLPEKWNNVLKDHRHPDFFVVRTRTIGGWATRQAVPVHDRNARFSYWNLLTVVVGGVALLLVVIGLLIPVRTG
jgi:hypothetical protein